MSPSHNCLRSRPLPPSPSYSNVSMYAELFACLPVSEILPEVNTPTPLNLSVTVAVCHCLSLSVTVCLLLSVYLSVCLSVTVCVSVSVSVSLCLCLSLSLSLCLSVCLSVCISLSPSLCPSVHHSLSLLSFALFPVSFSSQIQEDALADNCILDLFPVSAHQVLVSEDERK